MYDLGDVTEEAIRECLKENKEKLTEECIQDMTAWVMGKFENQDLLFGHPEGPTEDSIKELTRLEAEIASAKSKKHVVDSQVKDKEIELENMKKEVEELKVMAESEYSAMIRAEQFDI